jgi:GTP cyclohydrolase II
VPQHQTNTKEIHHDRDYRRYRPAWPLVIEQLLKTVPASQIVAIVRNPAKAERLSQQGIVVRQADYTDQAAFTGAERRG